ncbi:hypothetical protein C8T65DRAFT_56466 [Cerioporus squamosus]|nr:hypothetical protein C8T65DRAFT_56466 [Cerioporus squamosus]
MASNAQPPAFPSIDGTFGSLLIGLFVAAILYGFGVHQCYRYIRLFPTDTPSIRVVVILTMVLATFQTAVTIHAAYHYLVTNYFNPKGLTEAVWSANLMAVSAALVTIAAQSFFARRVSLISFKYKVLAAVSVAFLGVRLAAEIVLAVHGFTSNSVATYTDDRWVVALTCASSTAVDLLLSGSVFSVLWSSRRNARGNDSWIDLAIIYGVNTGILILLLDFLSLVFALARPNDLYWVSANIIGTRLAMNTVFCVLNSRKLLVSHGMEIFDAGSFGANIIARANRLAAAERWNVPQDPGDVPPAMIDIKVTREIEGEGGDGNSIEMSSAVRRGDIKNAVAEV